MPLGTRSVVEKEIEASAPDGADNHTESEIGEYDRGNGEDINLVNPKECEQCGASRQYVTECWQLKDGTKVCKQCYQENADAEKTVEEESAHEEELHPLLDYFGKSLSLEEMMNAVSEYVESNGLRDENNTQRVLLDDRLATMFKSADGTEAASVLSTEQMLAQIKVIYAKLPKPKRSKSKSASVPA